MDGRFGICLPGGGAKGAFQAGVLYELFQDANHCYSELTGTSIGAVNLYYVLKQQVERLRKDWNGIGDLIDGSTFLVGGLYLSNAPLIDHLRAFLYHKEDPRINKAYVNLVHVDHKDTMREVIVDIKNSDTAIEAIAKSSRLPLGIPEQICLQDLPAYLQKHDIDLKEQFCQNLSKGKYRNNDLDGGMIENYLLRPLIEKTAVKDVLIIALHNDFLVRKQYLHEQIRYHIIRPPIRFEPADTVRFENRFCSELFEMGVEEAIRWKKTID